VKARNIPASQKIYSKRGRVEGKGRPDVQEGRGSQVQEGIKDISPEKNDEDHH